jgi:hypothetical protein
MTLILSTPGVYAQASDTKARTTSNHGSFAYADYYQYIGAGSSGAYLSAMENKADRTLVTIIDSFSYELGYSISPTYPFAKTPRGNLAGGTLGYSFSAPTNDTIVIQGSYRSGKISYASPISSFTGESTDASGTSFNYPHLFCGAVAYAFSRGSGW